MIDSRWGSRVRGINSSRGQIKRLWLAWLDRYVTKEARQRPGPRDASIGRAKESAGKGPVRVRVDAVVLHRIDDVRVVWIYGNLTNHTEGGQRAVANARPCLSAVS